MAYKLQLPASSLILFYFLTGASIQIKKGYHFSLLKKAVLSTDHESSDLPLHCIETDHLLHPVAIVDSKLTKVGNIAVPFVSVQWSRLPVEWVTWENDRALQ